MIIVLAVIVMALLIWQHFSFWWTLAFSAMVGVAVSCTISTVGDPYLVTQKVNTTVTVNKIWESSDYIMIRIFDYESRTFKTLRFPIDQVQIGNEVKCERVLLKHKYSSTVYWSVIPIKDTFIDTLSIDMETAYKLNIVDRR